MVSWLLFFVLLIIMGILFACAVYLDACKGGSYLRNTSDGATSQISAQGITGQATLMEVTGGITKVSWKNR